MGEKYDKSDKIAKRCKLKIDHYSKKKRRKSKDKRKKHHDGGDDSYGDSLKRLYKGKKSIKVKKKRHNPNRIENSEHGAFKKTEFSYNSFDYFKKNVSKNTSAPASASEDDLSRNYIIEQKLKYEKDVFEKAYGLTLGNDICYDNFLFEKKSDNANDKTKENQKNQKNYECYSCKTKNYYSNVQCYKCKKLRKL